jgi:HK97 family phage major capsid protein
MRTIERLERTSQSKPSAKEERKFLRLLAQQDRIDGEGGELQLRDTAEYRALSVTLLTGGGATVPESFSGRLEMAMYYASAIRSLAEVVRTDDGADFPWPTSNDTANEGVIIAENAAATAGQDIAFGQVVLHAFKFWSKRVAVPQELIEDSPLLAGQLGEILGLRIGRIQNRKFTVGSGASEPNGIVNVAPVGVTAQQQTVFVADDLTALVGSVDPAYRLNGARFMMHPATFDYCKKLKDASGNLLYKQYVPGQPLLDGWPVTLNQHMATIATSAKVVLFGDFSRVKIRDARDLRLQTYQEATGLIEADQTAYACILRSDCALIDAGSGPVKSLQMHS